MAEPWLRALDGSELIAVVSGTDDWVQLPNVEVFGDVLPITPPHGYPSGFRKGDSYYRYTESINQPIELDEDDFFAGMRNVLIGLGEDSYVDLDLVDGQPPAAHLQHEYSSGAIVGGMLYKDIHLVESTVGIWRDSPCGLNPNTSVFQASWLPEPPEGAIGYEAELAEVQEGVFLPLAMPLSAHVAVEVYGTISTAYPNLEPWAMNFNYAMRANHVWRDGLARVDIDPLGYWVGEGSTPPWTAGAAVRSRAVAIGSLPIPELGTQGPEAPYESYHQVEGLVVELDISSFADDTSPYLGVFTLWESIDSGGLTYDQDGDVVVDEVNGSGNAAAFGRQISIAVAADSGGAFTYEAQPARFRWVYGELIEEEPVITGRPDDVRRRFT